MPKQRQKQTTTTTTSLPSFWTNTRLHAILIFVLSFLLYSNTLTHGYTQDDAIVLYDNMFTTEGVSGITGLLTNDTFFGFFKEAGKANLVEGGRYRPLTLIQFAIGYELFGDQPIIFHLMNVLWYAITCVVVYFLMRRLLLRYQNPLYVSFIALGTSLLFLAHPIHVEAVANIKGRDEIMTLLGSIAALYFALRGFDEKKGWMKGLAAVLFFLGLLAKENAITFLAVVPLSFYVFRKATIGESLKRMLPFLGIAVIYLVIRFSILGSGLGESSNELMNNPFLKIENNTWVDFTFAEWSATIIYTLGKYVQLLLFPHPLTHDYYPRQVDIMNWTDISVILSFLLYVGMTVYALIRLPKRDPVSFAILYYIITLSIVSNIVFPIGTNMGERFLFVPSLGFCLLATLLLWRLAKKLAAKNVIQQVAQLKVPLLIVGLLFVGYAAKSFTRNFVWKDNFTLFTTDVHHSPNSAKVRNAAAGALLEKAATIANEQERNRMAREALEYANKAIEIHPSYKNAYLLKGNAHNYLREYDASILAYEYALQLDPDYADAIKNLGITYREAGRYHGEQLRDAAQSISYLERGLAMTPQDVEVLRLLGIAYGVSGRPDKTVEFLERALTLSPQNASILYNLSAAYGQLGQPEKAQTYFDRAKAIDPTIGQ
ncbi:MAG: tetratricopeptide repeat protein [Bacteroidota bacterium]